MIHIILADHHAIFRAGVCALIAPEDDIEVVAEASDETTLETLMKHHTTGVLLIDVDFGAQGGGVSLTKKIKTICPAVSVIGFSRDDAKDVTIGMLKAGATGFLLKNASKEDMLEAIRAVASGDSYLSHEVSLMLLQQITPTPEKHPAPHRGDALTTRESEVLQLIVAEYTNHEIADKLFISLRTVDTHRRHLLEKLGVKNTAGLVKYALRQETRR